MGWQQDFYRQHGHWPAGYTPPARASGKTAFAQREAAAREQRDTLAVTNPGEQRATNPEVPETDEAPVAADQHAAATAPAGIDANAGRFVMDAGPAVSAEAGPARNTRAVNASPPAPATGAPPSREGELTPADRGAGRPDRQGSPVLAHEVATAAEDAAAKEEPSPSPDGPPPMVETVEAPSNSGPMPEILPPERRELVPLVAEIPETAHRRLQAHAMELGLVVIPLSRDGRRHLADMALDTGLQLDELAAKIVETVLADAAGERLPDGITIVGRRGDGTPMIRIGDGRTINLKSARALGLVK